MMMRSFALPAVLALLAAAWWLLRPSDWAHHGAALEPSYLTLRPGERAVVKLVNNEADVVALRFRLRFDASIIALDTIEPEHTSILTGGNAINLPSREQPGLVEVPGSAVIGGRVFYPSAPVYRFAVRGLNPGMTPLTVEDLTVVDLGDAERAVPASPSRVTVRDR
jgi:hypothetical protein